jgi:hypothetical protein
MGHIHKTFCLHENKCALQARVFVPFRPFQPGLIFASKLRSLPQRELTYKHSTQLERPVWDKHFNLFVPFVSYE